MPNPTAECLRKLTKFLLTMKSNLISLKHLGAVCIATVALLDAAPSKAVLYIDFIPLNATQTRIKASGTINPSLLAGSSSAGAINLSPTTPSSSRIGSNDDVRFNYNSSLISQPGRRYSITGPIINPFAIATNKNWTGNTPANNPPLYLRFTTNMDLWLPNTFTGGSTPVNQVKSLDGFFDVDATMADIGLASRKMTFTSGSEQIILRDATPTPGPLPLLGAAAAFGYSRKLRNRIQKSTCSRIS
jgi:hypothetical protein